MKPLTNSSSGKIPIVNRSKKNALNVRGELSISAETIKKNGAVYTPSILAKFVANKLFSYFSSFHKKDSFNILDIKDLKILDPACGDGELLISAWESLTNLLGTSNAFNSNGSLSVKNSLFGVDIDSYAIKAAKSRIINTLDTSLHKKDIKIIKTNALFPYESEKKSIGWNILCKRQSVSNGFDILISNPPWGAETSSYNEKLSGGDYKLFKGQYDTSDLFIELSLSIVKPNGFIAFIVSDSLFNKERTDLRRMLLENTEIKFIGRFGEKIFDNINRACAIIICKMAQPSNEHKIDCLRLTPSVRNDILNGHLSFEEVDFKYSHKISQSRFLTNSNYIFNIDLHDSEKPIINNLLESNLCFGNFLSSSRGVELSKSGKVAQCYFCGKWFPFPRLNSPKCPHCNLFLNKDNLHSEIIISKTKKKNYYPIFVGENINRYRLLKHSWIDYRKDGINYKDNSLYSGPKIIVRKTGVGILSMIDTTNALTNQVVYIFKLKESPLLDLPIEFFLALMNSRAMFYYLVKNHGETEWRSHPYLTQSQILDFPVPSLDQMKKGKDKIFKISRIVANIAKTKSGILPSDDAIIERYIADIWNLKVSDYSTIYKTINEVQSLVPVLALRDVQVSDIFYT